MNQLGGVAAPSDDGDSVTNILQDSDDGIDNAAFDQEGEDGCIMVDGKRAVTLQDFGKFAQANRVNAPVSPTSDPMTAKRRAFGSSIGFNVKDVAIDIHAESSKW